ncbi:hypothetical protein I312_100786 [Cryptococcus bacillisporus CA1280]|uniref:uncharacterized protein n=1 Tax=Cryptococcus bacillisporus CA1280 TaxID=1296109 RepID=UPI0033692603
MKRHKRYLKANYTISQFTWPVVRQAIFGGGSSSTSADDPKTATEIDSRRVRKREYLDALDNLISIYSITEHMNRSHLLLQSRSVGLFNHSRQPRGYVPEVGSYIR